MADSTPGQYGKLEIPVEFSTKSLAASSKAVNEEVKVQGRVTARAMVDALESQFKLDMARVKEGQARGFLTPAEARKAGAEAATAFNQGMVRVLDQQAAAGAFRGKAGKEAFTELAGSLKNVEQVSASAGIGFARLENQLITLATRATGASPAVGQVVDIVGTFAIGTAYMIPIVAGLAAIAFGINAITEKSREEKKALDEASDALEKSARVRLLGPEGETPGQEKKQEDRIAVIKQSIALQESIQRAAAQQGAKEQEEDARFALDALRKELLEREGLVREAQAHITEIERGGQIDRAEQVRRGIAVAEALAKSEASRREAAAKEAQGRIDRLATLGGEFRQKLAGLTAGMEDELLLQLDAFEAKVREAAAAAGVNVSQAFIDGMAALRKDAGQQQVFGQIQDQFDFITRGEPSPAGQVILRNYIAMLKEYSATLAAGSTTRKKYDDLIQRGTELLDKNAKVLAKATEEERKAGAAKGKRDRDQELRDLRDRARTIEESARAAIQLANALGFVSDEAAAALENLAQLGGAVFRIIGGDLTAIPAAIGAAAQLAKGLLGGGAEDKKRHQELVDALGRLTVALEEARKRVAGDLSETERTSLFNTGHTIAFQAERGGDSFRVDPAWRHDLERIAAVIGVPVDTLVDSDGRVNVAALQAALDRLAHIPIGQFEDTISGRIQARQFEDSIAGGTTDHAKRVDQFLDDMSQVGGGNFAAAIKKAIADGGPEAADAMIDEWAKRFAAGDQTLFDAGGPFAGLTADEVKSLLEEGNTLLEDWLQKSGGGTTQDFVQARSITEVTAGRLLGLDTTRNVLLTQIRDILATAMGIDPGALTAGGIPGLQASAQATIGAGSAGVALYISGSLIEGGIQVDARNGIVDAAQLQAEVTRSVLDGVHGAMDEIDRGLGNRYKARLRAAGRL